MIAQILKGGSSLQLITCQNVSFISVILRDADNFLPRYISNIKMDSVHIVSYMGENDASSGPLCK